MAVPVYGKSEILFESFFKILTNNINYLSKIQKIKPNKSLLLKNNNKRHEWYSEGLAIMKERLLFFNKLVKLPINNNNLELRNKYIGLRKKYKNSIRDAKLKNNVIYIETSKNKCKAAWNIIKENTEYEKKIN